MVNKRLEAVKQAHVKRRELKVMDKLFAKKAKENSRANRDEDMDYFAVYYKDKFAGIKFIAFKKNLNHPWRI